MGHGQPGSEQEEVLEAAAAAAAATAGVNSHLRSDKVVAGGPRRRLVRSAMRLVMAQLQGRQDLPCAAWGECEGRGLRGTQMPGSRLKWG